MRKVLQENKTTVNLHERLDTIPMDEFARLRAKAHLARAEFVAELIDRAARALRDMYRAGILRPIKRVFGAADP